MPQRLRKAESCMSLMMIRKRKMEDRVLLLGFKKGKELQDIVSGALCVCLPSEWYENGPYTIMEAQAKGRPVIVSRNGGLPELVEEGRTGFICTPGDAADLAEKIKKMAASHMDSAYIAEQAEKNYDADRYARHLLEIYKKLVRPAD